MSGEGEEKATGVQAGDSPAVSAVRDILGDKDFTDKQIQQLATIVRNMVEMMEG